MISVASIHQSNHKQAESASSEAFRVLKLLSNRNKHGLRKSQAVHVRDGGKKDNFLFIHACKSKFLYLSWHICKSAIKLMNMGVISAFCTTVKVHK